MRTSRAQRRARKKANHDRRVRSSIASKVTHEQFAAQVREMIERRKAEGEATDMLLARLLLKKGDESC